MRNNDQMVTQPDFGRFYDQSSSFIDPKNLALCNGSNR